MCTVLIGGGFVKRNIGHTIKFHRVNRKMTQIELAKGIISVSYLSKIENQTADASEEVIQLLCDRLEIDSSDDENIKLQKLCESWFELLHNRQVEQSHIIYNEINKYINNITDNDMLNLIEIHKLRYFILQKKKNDTETQFVILQRLSETFNDNESFYWLKFTGYYHFRKKSYNKALHYLKKAEKYLNYSFYLVEKEKAELYYMIALSASYIKKDYIVYDYASLALEHSNRKFDLKQTADCHILLGITFLNARNFERAIESFTIAEKISETISDKNNLAIATQNIGNLNNELNRLDDAISYLKRSYKLREVNHKKIKPLKSLVKVYYKMNDYENANYYLKKALNIVKQIEDNSLYFYDLEVYNQLINGFNSNFEHLLSKEVIPYFAKLEMKYEKAHFIEILANYYFDNRKYKLASIYYKQALDTKNDI